MISFLLAALLPVLQPVDAVVTDIEGTTTSISFVHDVLFPYARDHMEEYVDLHKHEIEVQKILNDVQNMEGISSEEVVPTLLAWMAQDKKITPLKTLQGLMWEDGYKRGEFQGHVYEDANQQLRGWTAQGLPIYIYSSGSVKAQKLLFSFSVYGDLTPFFSGFFDTNIGGKKESASYAKIAKEINVPPNRILFLSDSMEEIYAAKEAGMQTILVSRDGLLKDSDSPFITNFYDVVLP